MSPDIDFWHWWVAAAVLVAIEVFAPGVVFLWLGIAAAVVGLVVLLIPALGWELQLLAFALLAIVSVYAGRRLLRDRGGVSADPALNRRAQRYIGHVYTLSEPIVNGVGKVQAGDGYWTVEGPDMKAGTKVKVIGADSARLRVERAETVE
ncbi:MAG: NfeD family protein [Alphaproteobacteria bacterium]|jgi:membrane protein implicated in regulation of membrane protease activity|nr:NfeD family protein [Alphaproteobacteria bacterium]